MIIFWAWVKFSGGIIQDSEGREKTTLRGEVGIAKSRREGRYGRTLLVFLSFALLTIVMTWPAVGQLGKQIPGTIGDSYVHLWTFTWIKNNLFQLTSLDAFYTTQIYYPAGVSLLNHNLAWVNFAVWLPLQAIFGPEAGYTIAFLLIFPFNGLAAYLLAKELELSETAAYLTGLITSFWPYNLSHHGHPNLILIAWILFALLYLHRLSKNPNWRNTVWLGLFLGLIGITRWQLLIMAAPIVGIYALWLLFQERKGHLWLLLPKIIVSGLLSLLVMLPFLTPLLLFQTSRVDPTEVILEEFNYPTDLVAYFLPGSYHPIWGDSIRPIALTFVGNHLYVRTLGYTALLLVILGMFRQWPRAKTWAALLLLYLFLALGSDLYIAGQPTIPLPFRLIEDSFLIQTLRFPDRFNVITVIPFSLLAGLGLEHLLKRSPSTNRSRWTTGLVFLLILFEYLNVYQMLSVEIPDWYDQVAADEEVYSILDIPAFAREKSDSHFMYYQLFHGKPLISGNIARPPSESMVLFQSVPLLTHLRESEEASPEVANPSEQLRLLADADVRYVVLHKEYLSPNDVQSWKTWFVEPPWHEDEDLIIYLTDRPPIEQTVSLENILVGNPENPELGLNSANLTERLVQGGWLNLSGAWINFDAPLPSENLSACLRLSHTGSDYFSEQCRPISEQWPSPNWQRDEIVWASYLFQIDPFAETGSYEATLSLQASQGEPFGESISLGSVQVDALSRQFEPADPEARLEAQWEDLIFLEGYDLEISNESLAVSLHWYAPERLGKSYKFFVHLINVSSGELAAQIDYVPRDWTYPTNWWEAGEHVVDTAVLPLENVGSGTYQLLVGVYDPDTGARLLATASPGGNPVDALRLTEINR